LTNQALSAIVHYSPHFYAKIYASKKKGYHMQKITIEVKDDYMNNVLEMLHGLQGVMIEKIKFNSEQKEGVEFDFIKLQVDSMKSTWDNQEDEAWNDL